MKRGQYKTVLERIQDKMLVGDGCWEWTGAKNAKGYGMVHVGNPSRSQKAHRVLYALMVGSIAPGMTIDHSCYNTSCVRPSHLSQVTLQVNIAGRRSVGDGWATGARRSA